MGELAIYCSGNAAATGKIKYYVNIKSVILLYAPNSLLTVSYYFQLIQCIFVQIKLFIFLCKHVLHIITFFVFVQAYLAQDCHFLVFVNDTLAQNHIFLTLLKYIQPHLRINPAPLLRLMYNIPLHTASKQER